MRLREPIGAAKFWIVDDGDDAAAQGPALALWDETTPPPPAAAPAQEQEAARVRASRRSRTSQPESR
jgi:hypothetical protein